MILLLTIMFIIVHFPVDSTILVNAQKNLEEIVHLYYNNFILNALFVLFLPNMYTEMYYLFNTLHSSERNREAYVTNQAHGSNHGDDPADAIC